MASYNAGVVTAYGAAVRGGYTGTYEQFCAQQANYAQTAAAVEQAKTDAQAAAQRAQDVADSIPEDYTELTEEVGNLKDDLTAAQVELAKKANTDGYYEEMTVGNAEQLVSTVANADDTPYNFRTTAGSADVGDRAYVDAIVGGTLSVNQLVKALSSSNWSSETGVTASYSDGVATITSTTANNGIFHTSYIAVEQHKYFLAYSVYGTTGTVVALSGIPNTSHLAIDHAITANNTWERDGKIVSSELSGEIRLYALVRYSTYENVKIKDIMLFDLTQMFGSTIADYIYSIEQATAGAGVAWFRKLFPKPYYEYDAGTLKSVEGVSAHKTVGFNQWDEESEPGYWDVTDGTGKASTTWYRSKNPISCIPNTQYCISQSEAAGGLGYILFYDADGNYLNAYRQIIATIYGGTGEVFTTPANCYQMRFYTNVSNFSKNICINLSWDGEKDGTYEPYVEHTYPLDADVVLRGIPKLDASNNLYYDGDVYEADGTVTRRYGVVDLGSLTWSHTQAGYFYTTSINTTLKKGSAAGGYDHIKCALFVAQNVASLNSLTDKSMSVDSNGNIQIHDSAYPDNNAFKTAMSGVYLVYEKATASTETATPYNPVEIVDDFGTEEFITTSLVPVGHETRYAPNLRAKLEMSPDSPDGDGLYIVQQSSGENTYIPLASSATIQNILERLTALEGNTNEG